VAAAQRKVVDAHDLRRGRDLGFGKVDDQPQQRVAVHRDAQRGGQPHPGPPGQLQRDLRQ
jgi:hypothetical protein